MKFRVGAVIGVVVFVAGVASVAGVSCGNGGGGGGSALIGPAGGTITMGDGSQLVVPAGALSASTTITMTSAARVGPTLGGGIAGGSTYQMTPQGLTFAIPATLTLAFDPSALPAGTQASGLAIFSSEDLNNGGTGTGSANVYDTIVADATHVRAEINHFSTLWVAATNIPGYQNRMTNTGCQAGVGGVINVTFIYSDGGLVTEGGLPAINPYDGCTCLDGKGCPGADPTTCCQCPNGGLCPFNDKTLCNLCSGDAGVPDGGTSDGGSCFDYQVQGGIGGGWIVTDGTCLTLGQPGTTNDCNPNFGGGMFIFSIRQSGCTGSVSGPSSSGFCSGNCQVTVAGNVATWIETGTSAAWPYCVDGLGRTNVTSTTCTATVGSDTTMMTGSCTNPADAGGPCTFTATWCNQQMNFLCP